MSIGRATAVMEREDGGERAGKSRGQVAMWRRCGVCVALWVMLRSLDEWTQLGGEDATTATLNGAHNVLSCHLCMRWSRQC